MILLNKHKNLPLIFLFDLDNTIIGNSYYINHYYDIFNFISDECKHKRINKLCNIDKNIWKKNISKYFIRPYFKEFIEEIKIKFPTAEFYIYSAGTKKYVERIIEYIEEVINIKFNRPLFTRDDIGIFPDRNEWLKDITGFTDIIFGSLNKKYNLKTEDIEFILNERTIIIDDNEKVWNNNYRHIICPSYKYYPIIEIDNEILKNIYNNTENLYVYSMNYLDIILPKLVPNMKFNDFIMEYHFKMFILYKEHFKNNTIAINDYYFKILLEKLKNRKKYKKVFGKVFLDSIKKISQ